MKHGAILVNTSRGPIVDNRAMCEALANDRIAGLGLDVVAAEPDVPEALRQDERVLLTPHVAYYSDAAIEELRKKAAQTALDILRGEPSRNRVKSDP